MFFFKDRVVCPNFRHPALTHSFTKYNFFQMKNSFATLVNELSVLKLFQLSNGDLLFSKHDYNLYKARKPRMTKLGQGVGVRAHYPIQFLFTKGVSEIEYNITINYPRHDLKLFSVCETNFKSSTLLNTCS